MNRRRLLAALHALAVLLLAVPAAAQPQRAAPSPPLALPAGMSPLPNGAYRIGFRAGEAVLPFGAGPALAEIGRRLAQQPAGSGRVTVEGQASGPANDASAARRVALARALAVRAGLVAGGLEETRVDVRALGRTPAGLDAADILPPEATRGVQSGGAPRR
jgi:outer membrane protein OmpA-like peptidoglycan-associated protein